MRASVRRSLAVFMSARFRVTVSPVSIFKRASSSVASMMVPRKRLRLAGPGKLSSTLASKPACFCQSLVRVRGRSMPAELTSSVQAEEIGSSTSSTAERRWEISVQSSRVRGAPSARSAMIWTVGESLPMIWTRTSSKFCASRRGATMAAILASRPVCMGWSLGKRARIQ